jgi:UDPglucose 6-dehydrogenase
MIKSVGIIGYGCVGQAIQKSLELKNIQVFYYDKYKESHSFEDCLKSSIIFICVSTNLDNNTKEYNKKGLYESIKKLSDNNYKGIVVNKCTVDPLTILNLSQEFNNITIINNPEFLSSETAFEDFHHQKHIVLGKTENIDEKKFNILIDFYKTNFPDSEISICSSTEAEYTKIFCNSFYAVKVQFFNELYLSCQKNNCNYNLVRDMMVKNGWINPMHTNVPGKDGKLGYGGVCLPKDTIALLTFLKNQDTPCEIINSCINENIKLR